MNKIQLGIAFFLAILIDLADYVAFGWLPITGDILDILEMFLLLPLIGKYALLNLAELVPLADFLPIATISVILAWREVLE